jgi:hypothetical protein
MKEQRILWWAGIDLSTGIYREERNVPLCELVERAGSVLDEASVRPPNVLL